MYYQILKRALIFVLLSPSLESLAAVISKDESSVNETIAFAQKLTISRQRTEALKILISALEKEKTEALRARLYNEIRRTGEIFYTNEGQKAYELAESIRLSGQSGYLAKYDEAIKIEGQNIKIIKSKALGLITNGECRNAVDFVLNSQAANLFDVELELIKFQADICVGGVTNKSKINNIEKKQEYGMIMNALNAEKAFGLGKSDIALSYARDAIKHDESYPGGYYWAWKVLSVEQVGLDEGQKYLSLCKVLGPSLRRKYYFDGRLCRATEEVEEYLKKLEGQQQ